MIPPLACFTCCKLRADPRSWLKSNTLEAA
jgi:hypothetical protein